MDYLEWIRAGLSGGSPASMKAQPQPRSLPELGSVVPGAGQGSELDETLIGPRTSRPGVLPAGGPLRDDRVISSWARGPGSHPSGMVPQDPAQERTPLPWEAAAKAWPGAPPPFDVPPALPDAAQALADMPAPELDPSPQPQQQPRKGGGGGRGRGGGASSYAKGIMGDSQAQQDAVQRGADIQAQKAEFEGAERKKALLENAARSVEDEKHLAEVMRRADEGSAALRREVADIANTRIDNNRIFKNTNALGHAANIGAIIFSAFGAKGGPNRAVALIQKRVEQDIDAQIQDLSNRRAGVQMQNTLLQQDLDRGMKLSDAKTKATAVALERAAQVTEAEAKKFDAQGFRVQGEQVAAGLRMSARTLLENNDMERRKLALTAAAQAENRRQFNVQHMQRNLEFGAGLVQHELDASRAGKAAGQKAREGEVWSPAMTVIDAKGMPVQMPSRLVGVTDPESAKAARKMVSDQAAVLSAVDQYRKLLNQLGPTYQGYGPKSREGAQADTLHSGVINTVKNMLVNTGANWSPREEKLVDALVPSPTGWTSIEDRDARLTMLMDYVQQQANARMGGLVPNAQPVFPSTFGDLGGQRTGAAKPAEKKDDHQRLIDRNGPFQFGMPF